MLQCDSVGILYSSKALLLPRLLMLLMTTMRKRRENVSRGRYGPRQRRPTCRAAVAYSAVFGLVPRYFGTYVWSSEPGNSILNRIKLTLMVTSAARLQKNDNVCCIKVLRRHVNNRPILLLTANFKTKYQSVQPRPSPKYQSVSESSDLWRWR